jgi:hypothetical protein
MTTCSKCGHTFDDAKVPEAGMGYVKCPECGAPVAQRMSRLPMLEDVGTNWVDQEMAQNSRKAGSMPGGEEPSDPPGAADKFMMSSKAASDFDAYEDVVVTWPSGRSEVINRKKLEDSFGADVTSGSLEFGYPGCTIAQTVSPLPEGADPGEYKKGYKLNGQPMLRKDFIDRLKGELEEIKADIEASTELRVEMGLRDNYRAKREEIERAEIEEKVYQLEKTILKVRSNKEYDRLSKEILRLKKKLEPPAGFGR